MRSAELPREHSTPIPGQKTQLPQASSLTAEQHARHLASADNSQSNASPLRTRRNMLRPSLDREPHTALLAQSPSRNAPVLLTARLHWDLIHSHAPGCTAKQATDTRRARKRRRASPTPHFEPCNLRRSGALWCIPPRSWDTYGATSHGRFCACQLFPSSRRFRLSSVLR